MIFDIYVHYNKWIKFNDLVNVHSIDHESHCPKWESSVCKSCPFP